MIAPGRTLRIAVAVAAFWSVGCVGGGQAWNPFPDTAPALTTDADADAIVAHLNRNTSRCTGWRSTDVRLKAEGVPFSLRAMVAVESPRRFRLVASAANMDQADLGCNDERMWFWVRQSPHKNVFTCSHDDLPAAQQRLPLPFRPDWLMEVLGVIPLDPTAFVKQPDAADAGLVRLVSEQVSATGEPVRRIVTVDTRRGVVVGHALHDGAGRLIAHAKLADHRPEPASGIVLPRRIELSVPEADAHMVLTIGSLEVNPRGVSDRTWELPRIAGCPLCDLGLDGPVTQ